MKQSRVAVGEQVTFEDSSYHVIAICRGEGQARAKARTYSGPRKYYRTVRGQWCVLKRVVATPTNNEPEGN